jgi:hypothetical protein
MYKLFTCSLTAATICLTTVAHAAPVKSAKSYGYRGDDIKKYDRLIGKYSKKKCGWVQKENVKATKVAGKKAKGTGGQVVAGLLNQRGTSGAGLLAQVGSNVVKDGALRRDASAAVLKAKACK